MAEMSLDEVVGSDARPVAVVDTIAADAADAPGAHAEQLAEADVTRDLMRVVRPALHACRARTRCAAARCACWQPWLTAAPAHIHMI